MWVGGCLSLPCRNPPAKEKIACWLPKLKEQREMDLWRSEQRERERPALKRMLFFSIVKATLIIFGVQTVTQWTFSWPAFTSFLKYNFHYVLELINTNVCIASSPSLPLLNFRLLKWKSGVVLVAVFNLA